MLFDADFSLHDLSGILPRTAVFLFEEKTRLTGQMRTELKLEISAIEIYCDELRDLFSKDNSNKAHVDLKIDPKTKKVFVQNQTCN